MKSVIIVWLVLMSLPLPCIATEVVKGSFVWVAAGAAWITVAVAGCVAIWRDR